MQNQDKRKLYKNVDWKQVKGDFKNKNRIERGWKREEWRKEGKINKRVEIKGRDKRLKGRQAELIKEKSLWEPTCEANLIPNIFSLIILYRVSNLSFWNLLLYQ